MKDEKTQLQTRPPIVVVMGHVDHGKTTLLDYIRKTNVAAGEAGGITQAVGAYEIIHNGKKVTFIDTPGHEAFSKMRSRGAEAADLAILVVAAEEGLKPQTEEAIKILEASKTPFIVAINKIDKPGANIEKVKNELLNKGVLLEGMGGNVSYQPISAKVGTGVEELLDLILLAAELEDLKFDPKAPASGYILEAKLDKRRGNEVSLILKNGTLRQGDLIGTERARGKIKILEDFRGDRAKELVPCAPALVIGFEALPEVGEEFFAGEGAHGFQKQGEGIKKSLPAYSTRESDKENLHLILKASDAGSLEALSAIIRNLPVLEHKELMVVDESVGDVSDNDVKRAVASRASIIGFKSDVPKNSKFLADNHGIKIVTSAIVYELVKAVEDLLKGDAEGNILGELEILAVFNQAKLEKQLVGGKVVRGSVRNREGFEVLRGGKKVGVGRLTNLQTGKKDVHQVPEGSEAGLMVSADIAIETNDKLVLKK